MRFMLLPARYPPDRWPELGWVRPSVKERVRHCGCPCPVVWTGDCEKRGWRSLEIVAGAVGLEAVGLAVASASAPVVTAPAFS